MNCQHCGQPMIEIKAFNTPTSYQCSNASCPSKHSQNVCPKCKSADISIKTFGISTFQFNCNMCGNNWSSLDQE